MDKNQTGFAAPNNEERTMAVRAFGKLPRKEQTELFEAVLDGEEVEFYSPDHHCWFTTQNPGFFSDIQYRLKTRPITKPSIDWDDVHSDFNWMATDKNGGTWLFENEPRIKRDQWWEELATYPQAEAFSSFKPGTCDWESSLVRRPD